MKILLLNQCFYPDVVSTAQHLTDLALELTDKGHKVTVIAGNRGYDNPLNRFPKRETWRGITIIRIPSLSLGKDARWRRALTFASFLVACTSRLILLPRFDVVVGLTSPPLISVLGSLFARLKGGKFVFWVMDLNPDEAVAAGWLKQSSLAARILGAFLRYSLRGAEKVIVLDRFMRQRVFAKGVSKEKVVVVPPWSHTDVVAYDPVGRSAFRARHGLSDKYVVMYSGNHTPCHPLDTLLQAASQLASNPAVSFCFVGGGSEYAKVESYAKHYRLNNILCLPYQPLNELGASLSAADLHVVVMGDPFPGIVHPCKIYNILEVGGPVLYIGPADSHLVDILSELDRTLLCSARHDEAEVVSDYVRAAAENMRGSRWRCQSELCSTFSKEALLPRMVEIIESASNGKIGFSAVLSDGKRQSQFDIRHS